jgi:hypothetical protein
MSIRFKFKPIGGKSSEEYIKWCRDNIPVGEYYIAIHGYTLLADFLNEGDAIMFSIQFGIPKHSTALERMIVRETFLEEMERDREKYATGGIGYPIR